MALITELRKDLVGRGLDAGPLTIAWHLEHHHRIRVSPAAISRYLARAGLVTPQPRKRHARLTCACLLLAPLARAAAARRLSH